MKVKKGIFIPKELEEQINKICKQQDRSFNYITIKALEQYVAQHHED